MNNASPSGTTYEILATNTVANPKEAAERFSGALSVEKGVRSTVVCIDAATYDCVADDNRAIRFEAE